VYQFSRAIYRELAEDIIDAGDELSALPGTTGTANHTRVLASCEAAVERLATDPHYFARPARTLFQDIRIYFPLSAQRRVYKVVEHYVKVAEEFFAAQPQKGYDAAGNPLECRATTRRGTPCQRVPLPHNGYCPSHQHLVETEEMEALASEQELELVAA
jgi:hypothetical protein